MSYDSQSELPAKERLPQERRSRQPAPREPENLSIQLHIPLTGRRALLRSTVGGGNLLLFAMTQIIGWETFGAAASLILGGGAMIFGGLAALSAWAGQRMARRLGPPEYAEMAWRTNWSAVLYAGVFAGQLAALGLAVSVLSTSTGIFGTALVTALSTMAIGGAVSGGLTAGIGAVRRWLHRGDAPPEERLTISIS